MKSFHFDVGNSSTGPIGFCARVRAKDEADALRILRERLPQEIDAAADCLDDDTESAIEYAQMYLNLANITALDIDDSEDV